MASSKVPQYSLSIVEGESTIPEDSITGVSARAENAPSKQVVLSISRGGVVIARDQGNENAGLGQVPQAGDVVTMESPASRPVGVVVYDGLPSIDLTVCAGSTNFSGQRSGAQEVQGGYYTLVQHTNPYGETSVHRTASGQSQVTALVGGAYSGNFLTPLQLGETVWASESSQTTLEGGAILTYSSENDRPVGACPVPPAPPPPPPPPPPALQGSIFKLVRTTIHKLLKSGWHDQVTINQPGTVIQNLFLAGGTVPALASSRGHHRRRPALLLARGSSSAKSAGNVTVVIRATSKGRRILGHRKHVRAKLVTTLLSGSGAKLSLGARTVTLDR
ncbi:MAG TPA: hypothetical protein VGI76_04265 [Solirubrobacteraceae bacterium]